MATAPSLSKRISTLHGQGGDGWDLYYKAQAAKAAGHAITDLTIGEPDMPPDPSILAAMDDAARSGGPGYTPAAGLPALRTAIANRVESRTGVSTGPENIAVTAGGQAALFAAHVLTCGDGGTGLFLDPFYATYPATIRAAGGVAKPIGCPAATGFLPDVSALEADLRTASSLLITTPGNPTGRSFDADLLDQLVDATRASGTWLISDEVYDGLSWTDAHVSARSRPGATDHTLIIGSMSKSFAMTGARLGWVVGPPLAIEAIEALSSNTNFGFAPFVQEAALFALTKAGAFEQHLAATFRRRRDAALETLNGAPNLRALPPEGGMFVMVDVSATGQTAAAFAEALFDATGIAVMPGSSFGEAARDFVRVALTTNESILTEALGQMAAFAATSGRV